MAFGFRPAVINQGHMQGWEYKPAAADTYTVGMALNINSSGQFAAVTGTTAPTHLCMTNVTASAGDIIAAIAVEHDALYETEVAGSVATGSKYTINSTSDGITTTTTSGVALVVDKLGNATTASGDHVLVRL